MAGIMHIGIGGVGKLVSNTSDRDACRLEYYYVVTEWSSYSPVMIPKKVIDKEVPANVE